MRYHSLLPEQEIWKDYGWTCVESVRDENRNQLTLWSEAMTIVQDKTIFTWLTEYALVGSSTDVIQVSLLKLKADTSDFSSWEWPTSGIIYAGECWMLNCLEGPARRHVYLVGYFGEDKDCASQALLDPFHRNYPLDTDDASLS